MEPYSIPVLSSQIILVPAPHQEQTEVSEGFGSAMAERSQLQPPSSHQPKTKVTMPPQLVPSSATVPAQALSSPCRSGGTQVCYRLVGFCLWVLQQIPAQELGDLWGCASRTLELYFVVFFFPK